jgi:hypothetical protein
VEAIGEVSFRGRTSAQNGIPTDLTRLTLRRSAAVYSSGGDRVKDLTPDVGPHSHRIAHRGQSTRPTDACTIARPTGDDGGICRRLEPLIASPDPVDHLAEVRATSIQTFTAAGTRRTARRAETSAEPPPISRASRR